MIFGNIDGLVNGTEQVVFDYEVTGSAAADIPTGNILNGDEDGWYTIIVRNIPATNGRTMLRFNGDSGSNYGWRGVTGINSSAGDATSTTQNAINIGHSATTAGDTEFSVSRLYAKSGSVRLVNSISTGQITSTTVSEVKSQGAVWTNTADNIVSMLLLTDGTFAVGTRVIILKSNNFTNGTPTGVINTPYIKGSWVRVGSSVLGSAASSVTFSGLDGDRDVLYYLSSSIKAASATGDIKINLNNDTGNNYGYQRLTGTNTTVAAARATPSCLYGGVTGTNAYSSQHNTLLFAKQGFLRPAITQTINDITGTTVTAIWTLGQSYSVTNTNITEIDIAVTTNNFDTGSQFDLYALRPNG